MANRNSSFMAMGMINEPEMVVLDEPTSNLDPATCHELTEYLRSLQAARIVATHDLALVRNLCSRCILLSGGRQVASGSTIEILENLLLLRQHRMAGG